MPPQHQRTLSPVRSSRRSVSYFPSTVKYKGSETPPRELPSLRYASPVPVPNAQAPNKERCPSPRVPLCESFAMRSLASACWSVVIRAASRCSVGMVLPVWLPALQRLGLSFPQAVAFSEAKFLHDALAGLVSRLSSGIGRFRGVEV